MATCKYVCGQGWCGETALADGYCQRHATYGGDMERWKRTYIDPGRSKLTDAIRDHYLRELENESSETKALLLAMLGPPLDE